MRRICIAIASSFLIGLPLSAQLKTEIPNMGNNGLLTDMIDTSTAMGRNMLALYNKFSHVGFSGYLQPQFQISQTEGNNNIYQGGEWGKYSANRFRPRRGRLRTDFSHYLSDGSPSVYFLFQFDGTEKGVNIRDFWGRYYENKLKLFHFSAGMMARPFGHEILYSSFYREAPERGRMSQILMNTERDIGFMVSLNPRMKSSKLKWLGIDLGVYNGQGLTGPTEYDSHKDVIVRISSKKQKICKSNIRISGGLSGYFGGITSQNATLYSTQSVGGIYYMQKDSSVNNIGKNATRRYLDADMQIIIPNGKTGQSEFRAEYTRGLQTATLTSSTTPGTLPVDANNNPTPLTTRKFDGAYFYFLQNIGSWSDQLVLKYDWYDPNKKVSGQNVDPSRGFTSADVRYNTWGAGLLHYFNDYLKVVVWYEKPLNEKTQIDGYKEVRKEGILTIRTQFSF